MFIRVTDSNYTEMIINSDDIKSITVDPKLESVRVYPEGLGIKDDTKINTVSFSIFIKDFDDNIYFTNSINLENTGNKSKEIIQQIILDTIETTLNSSVDISSSFYNEIKNKVAFELK